jgi:cobalamin biosynthesis protein CobD/CbiB
VPGAIAFRAINTLDSMVGYKDPEHANIGWFSAKMDTIANYIPARNVRLEKPDFYILGDEDSNDPMPPLLILAVAFI